MPLPAVYIAGAWAHRAEIAAIIKQVQGLGAVVTHDWTRNDELADQAKAAVLDVDAVKAADVVLLVMTDPAYAYRGTCTELGVALGCECKHVWIAGPDTVAAASNVFWHHPRVRHFATVDEALVELVALWH